MGKLGTHLGEGFSESSYSPLKVEYGSKQAPLSTGKPLTISTSNDVKFSKIRNPFQ